jgi:predicted acetyltransferase
MRPVDLTVGPFRDPDSLSALEADAVADACVMVSRFLQDWRSGQNRFARPGEKAYIAMRGERICAVCGLNRDPFATDDSIGRVRRLYVAVQDRRSGIGTAVIDRLMADACGVYTLVHLRTHDPEAAAF